MDDKKENPSEVQETKSDCSSDEENDTNFENQINNHIKNSKRRNAVNFVEEIIK